MIQKIIKLSNFPLLNKVLAKGKTIIAHNKKNYSIELEQIRGDKIIHTEEFEANQSNNERKNLIKLDLSNNKSKYLAVFNGEDGDEGNKGLTGDQGYKGNSFDKRKMLEIADDALVIVNDNETNDPNAVWSAYRGKIMEAFLRSISEMIVTDDEYQLLFNDQVFIDMEFVTKNDNQSIALVHNDNKEYKTYVKYWTYEDDVNQSYYILTDDNTYQEVIGFDLWNDLYLNPNNNETYYTRQLVITETDPITGEVVSSEYQYTPIIKPIWIDLEFTTTEEDQKSILLSNKFGEDDPSDISKEEKEEEIIILHRPITSISIEGDNNITIPINSIMTKAINIQPIDYLNSPICIEYDETKIEVFEDGRIMALENNCETEIKIYSEENPNIQAFIHVNVVTYVEGIQLSEVGPIKGFPGTTKQIIATVYPNTASNKNLIWSSSDNNIASVDENGLITLNNIGSATIEVQTTDRSENNNIIARIGVNVDVAIEDILFDNINPDKDEEGKEVYNLEVLVGIPTQIPVTILPSDASNQQLIWETNDNFINIGVAENNRDGQIYVNSKDNGKVIVKPTDGSNVIKELNIIGKIPVRNITLNETNLKLDLGEQVQLICTINENADNKDIIWTSSNPEVATVDSNGNVTTLTGGITIITATAADGSGVSATCEITSVVLITDIIFNEKTIRLHAGSTYLFRNGDNYTIKPDNANVINLNWYTSNNKIASINNNGEIVAHKAGKVKVYASATDNSGIIASADIIVTIPSQELSLSSYDLTLNIDQSYTLIATVTPDDTSLQNVEFTSTDPSVATVDSNGNINAISSGETSIFVRTLDTNISNKCTVTVL